MRVPGRPNPLSVWRAEEGSEGARSRCLCMVDGRRGEDDGRRGEDDGRRGEDAATKAGLLCVPGCPVRCVPVCNE